MMSMYNKLCNKQTRQILFFKLRCTRSCNIDEFFFSFHGCQGMVDFCMITLDSI